MNVAEARRRVKMIEECASDYEIAHGAEDDLRRDFIRWACTCGYPNVEELAEIIKETEAIDFARYLA